MPGTKEEYVVFDHGEDPLDSTDLYDTYLEAKEARRKSQTAGKGIAEVVYEYAEVQIVDESYAPAVTETAEPEPGL